MPSTVLLLFCLFVCLFPSSHIRSFNAPVRAGQQNQYKTYIAAKFGDTLPSESGDAGQHRRLSESQSVSLGDSYKPLRRAQIFDKGVDASMMQVMLGASFRAIAPTMGDGAAKDTSACTVTVQ